MTETIQQTVVETLDYLMTIVRQGTRPEEAQHGLRPLQRRHSGTEMQLVWEEETYDHSIHYDALLNVSGAGTISISYCDDRDKPWPLRGVHRWSDADLVRVDNHVLTVDQAIACLDFIWDEAPITDRLVNVCLIQEELKRNPIELSDQDLQIAMDGFRRTRKLYLAADTYRWMERRGTSYQELEQLVGSQAMIVKLRDSLVADRVQEYFDANSAGFDTAYIARLKISDEKSALELCDRISNGSIDFFSAAQSNFLAVRQTGQTTPALFASLQRREAPPELRTQLFQSSPDSLLGPVREGDGYAIILVLSVVPARLDDVTRDAIKKILFEEWLEERRQTATIDWLWGNANKTDRAARTTVAELRGL